MNNKQILLSINSFENLLENAHENLVIKNIYKNGEYYDTEVALKEYQKSAIKVAIEALEKQIEYKPTTNKLVVGVGRCKCGSEFLDKSTGYCGNCGQKLDWS